MSNTVYHRPSINVGFDFISKEFPWPSDDLKEFNAVRKEFDAATDLVLKVRADVQQLKVAEQKAHVELIKAPSASTIAAAEEARKAVSAAEAELPRTLQHIEYAQNELARNRLGSVAAKLNRAIAEWLMIESKTVEDFEKSIVAKYNASSYAPSELLRALIHRAGTFYTAADSIQRLANLGARSCTPSGALCGVIPPTDKPATKQSTK